MTAPPSAGAQLSPVPGWDGWLVGAVALGIAVRAFHVMRSDFPLNDGGLFVMMIEALRANHYALPHSIPWAQFELPFAYPPFAFYLAAAARDLTGISTIELLRILPFVGSAAAIIAFAGFAKAYLTSRLAVVASVVAFGLMPQGYVWVISGGGLTRAFGVAFSLLALDQLLQQFRHPTPLRLATACACSALTVLTHPESATLYAVSALLLTLAFGRSGVGLRSSFLVGFATLVLTAPWWILILSRYGLQPFLAGGGNAPGIEFARLLVAAGGLNALVAVVLVVLCGLYVAMCWIAFRGWFVTAWCIAVLLFSRNFNMYSAAAVALFLGMAYDRWLPLGLSGFRSPTETATGLSAKWGPRTVAVFLLALAAVTATNSVRLQIPTLSHGERDAMAWISSTTPRPSSVLILTQREEGSSVDPTGDWFAALTGRVGLSPPQGTEWIGRYPETEAAYARLQSCRARDTACLEQWASDEGLEFAYVYVPAPARVAMSEDPSCCDEVVRSLLADPDYRLVYNGAGASVFERIANTHR